MWASKQSHLLFLLESLSGIQWVWYDASKLIMFEEVICEYTPVNSCILGEPFNFVTRRSTVTNKLLGFGSAMSKIRDSEIIRI